WQFNALPVGHKARVRVHFRNHDMVVVLAEEQRLAVRGIGDARERSRLAGHGLRAFHRTWRETLEDLPRRTVEDNDRLRRAHQQNSPRMDPAIRVESDGLCPHWRTEINHLA